MANSLLNDFLDFFRFSNDLRSLISRLSSLNQKMSSVFIECLSSLNQGTSFSSLIQGSPLEYFETGSAVEFPESGNAIWVFWIRGRYLSFLNQGMKPQLPELKNAIRYPNQ